MSPRSPPTNHHEHDLCRHQYDLNHSELRRPSICLDFASAWHVTVRGCEVIRDIKVYMTNLHHLHTLHSMIF